MKKLIQISIKTLALAALIVLLASSAQAQRSQRNPYMPFPGNIGSLNSSFPGDASPAFTRMPNNDFSPAFQNNPFDGKLGGNGNDNQPSKLKGIVCYETSEACLGIYSFPSSHEVNVNNFFTRVDLVFNGNTNGVSISADLDVQYLQGGNDVELLDFVWQIDRDGDGTYEETLSSTGKNTTIIANTVNKTIRLRYAPKLIQVSNMQETGCGRKGISVQPVFSVLSIS